MISPGTCRACKAPVYWARQVDEETGGVRPGAAANPIDVTYAENGNIDLNLVNGTYRIVTPGSGLRVSHWVTCPKREVMRRAQRIKKARERTEQAEQERLL